MSAQPAGMNRLKLNPAEIRAWQNFRVPEAELGRMSRAEAAEWWAQAIRRAPQKTRRLIAMLEQQYFAAERERRRRQAERSRADRAAWNPGWAQTPEQAVSVRFRPVRGGVVEPRKAPVKRKR